MNLKIVASQNIMFRCIGQDNKAPHVPFLWLTCYVLNLVLHLEFHGSRVYDATAFVENICPVEINEYSFMPEYTILAEKNEWVESHG